MSLAEHIVNLLQEEGINVFEFIQDAVNDLVAMINDELEAETISRMKIFFEEAE